MIEDVGTIITGATGYSVPPEDESLLKYLWDSEGVRIKNDTNQDEVPEGLDGCRPEERPRNTSSSRKRLF